MGIHSTEYIQLALIALMATCLLAIYNRKPLVVNLKTHIDLGGWLYVVCFCFTSVLGYFYYTSFNLFQAIFFTETNQVFFDTSHTKFGGYAALYVKVELLVNILIAIAISYLAYAFIGQRRNFRKLYLPLHALVLGYLICAQIAWIFIPEFNHFTIGSNIEIAIIALGALVWIPYMLKSKRVASTFVL